ncbi:MAG TPA: hypothetical protein VEB21_19080 [Terriglobales bacterium]|nr:hypothetical protein [Terriglobales bacterium]
MEIYQRVIEFIRAAASGAAREPFERLALDIFTHQFASVPSYREACERRGLTPADVDDWRAVPPVPALAFKHVELSAGPPQRVFRTTGTTQGAESRGRHAMPCLELYEVAAVSGMKQFLFPEVERIRILSLIHTAAERPESSLAQMVDWAIRDFGAAGSATFVVGDHLDCEGLVAALRAAEQDGNAVCLMATTAALMRFVDYCRERSLVFRLAHASRLMDTGGSKGTSRPLSRNGLMRAVWEMLAIPGYYVANEYGMTEMSSQFYDNVIRERNAGRFGRRSKAGPPWVRTRILDPVTLTEVAAGETGVLCHTDLANAGSAMVVLTEDLGHSTAGGFEITGRIEGAEARGCSLALAEYLRS